ncbi:type IV secretory system conjugative DNA transfer family protein [Rhodobacter sp. 24-YEA-8]|uniref:type IV secretory system conjugative DNA transfer family protein n=1 Tax=Rhodobacter sp. 24-YEA-8 TaxID=1884310 RepID=UPI00089CB009|nr:type IV secretory system conjugative DNA transfer family protein [Rhodobacter sp. 24-YEA-8]SEB90985.1 Type IV secretory pathway, VirD4 component, TraG/TraD family ATPase [Rhodobacter sp. 24-YEA-8]
MTNSIVNLPTLHGVAHSMSGAVTNTDASHIPLGTAAWHNLDAAGAFRFRTGDLWLSRDLAGEPAGYRDDRHVLLVSGTRMGKGASVIVPNLCLWPGSVVVIDPKGENAMVTARRRGAGSAYSAGLGQRVLILDPFGEVVRGGGDDFADMRAAFNPLDVILTRKREAVDDAARMADALIVSEGGGDSFFDDTAKGIIKALILHVASDRSYADHQRNLLTLRHALLAGDDEMRRLLERNGVEELPSGISLLFARMRHNGAFGGVVAKHGAMLQELLEASPRTLMSALQVARTNTDFLDSPALRSCLDRSSFQLSDLKTAPTSPYLCLPQRFMGSHYRWLRMMTTLILGEMERARVRVPPKHPMLMVLDEFPALGRMKVIENAAAQIAGYGVKMMFVSQNMAQLKDVYKDNWETMVANAGVKLFFGNDDNFTREYVSKMIGDMELRRWAQSYSHSEGRSQSESHGTQRGYSGNRTIGSSSSASFGQNGSFTLGDSRSASEGWSRGESRSTTHGTSEGNTKGASETFHKRPSLTPDEVGRLFGSRQNPAMLALISGLQPVALKRTLYFTNPVLAEKFDPHRDHAPPLTRAQIAQRDMAVFFKHVLATPPPPAQNRAVAPSAQNTLPPREIVLPVRPARTGLVRLALRSATFMALKILAVGGAVAAYAIAIGF